jgi:hypothetical protein
MELLNYSTVMSPDRDIGLAGLAAGMDIMLVLNMSIFNSGRGWNHRITPFPEHLNVWST